MSYTTDRNDPELRKKKEDGSNQNEKYLVLSDDEIAKGFVRPLRDSYVHKKCGALTKMGIKLAETYAANPKFYGATFCVGCKSHFPVSEFLWDGTDEEVGS